MESTATLTLAQAYAFLGVSEKSLRNYCKARKLPFQRVKNARGVWEYRFDPQALAAFKARRAPATPTGQDKQPDVHGTDAGMYAGIANSTIGTTTPGEHAGHIIPPDTGTVPESPFRDALLRQLLTENAFLREQLVERDRQLALKDRQIERQLERMSGLNDSLTALAQDLLKR